MSQDNSLIPASRFLELLADREAFSRLRHTFTTVMNDVRINGKEIKLTGGSAEKPSQSISLDNFNFLGSVEIQNFDALAFSACESNFLQGIRFENCSGRLLYMRGCRVESIRGYSNVFEMLSLKEIQGPPAENPKYQRHPLIQLGAFKLTEKLVLEKVVASELELASKTDDLFSAPAAMVDDPLWAMQLKLAGVSVYVSTEVAKAMLAEGSYAARVATAA